MKMSLSALGLFFPGHGRALDQHTGKLEFPAGWCPWRRPPSNGGWGAASLTLHWLTRSHVLFCISEFPGGVELRLPPMESGFITHTSLPGLASTPPPGVALHWILVVRPVCLEGNPNWTTEGNYWHMRPEGPEAERASRGPWSSGPTGPSSPFLLSTRLPQHSCILGTIPPGGQIAVALPGFPVHSGFSCFVLFFQKSREDSSLGALAKEEAKLPESLWSE